MNNSYDKTERLLALLLLENMKEATKERKIKALNIAGFTNVEIAELLSTTPQVIYNTLYVSKKKKKK